MNRNLYCFARYFGWYIWFLLVIGFFAGALFSGCFYFLFSEQGIPDNANLTDLNAAQLSVVLCLLSIFFCIVVIACKWGLEQIIKNGGRYCKISYSSKKIKFSIAALFQLKVLLCSVILWCIVALLPVKISTPMVNLLDIATLIIANYFMFVQWLSKCSITISKEQKTAS